MFITHLATMFLTCTCLFFPHACFAGYCCSFRVDLRDGTSVSDMMREVLIDFNVPGICIYADNAFVSVDQLRWCRDNKINLCGTTRSTFGFPAELDFDGMEVWSDS